MDYVSSLPDEVLCHILSFLTIKEAALTSVLSERWRDLFAFVPNLDLDDSVFLHPEEGKRERDGVVQSFMDFVDRVLALRRDSPIHKVSLKCQTGVSSNRLDSWITNVLERGVSKLDLCIVFGDGYWLSSQGFKSTNLVKLKIASGINLGWSSHAIFLPMLKTLILESVEFCVDKFEMLLPACPALEALDMVNVKGLDSNETLSSASLKILRIQRSVGSGSFSLDAPSLVYLDYSDLVAEDYPLANLDNLLEARIQLIAGPPESADAFTRRMTNLAKLMNGIRNVHKLYLTSVTLEILPLCCESMPVFNNLKWLGFCSGESRWGAVPVLLAKCPHLETLNIGGLLHFVTDACGDVCDCISREDKGRSLKSSPVKRIEIEGFIGAMREITMINHFLDYFPCLQEIEISVESYGPVRLDVPEVTDLRMEMMKLFEKSLSCNVYLVFV